MWSLPQPDSREQLSWSSVATIVLPSLACYYVCAVLTIRFYPVYVRMSFLPITLGMLYRCAVSLDMSYTDGSQNDWLNYRNETLLVCHRHFFFAKVLPHSIQGGLDILGNACYSLDLCRDCTQTTRLQATQRCTALLRGPIPRMELVFRAPRTSRMASNKLKNYVCSRYTGLPSPPHRHFSILYIFISSPSHRTRSVPLLGAPFSLSTVFQISVPRI